jgi:hypothetical protein
MELVTLKEEMFVTGQVGLVSDAEAEAEAEAEPGEIDGGIGEGQRSRSRSRRRSRSSGSVGAAWLLSGEEVGICGEGLVQVEGLPGVELVRHGVDEVGSMSGGGARGHGWRIGQLGFQRWMDQWGRGRGPKGKGREEEENLNLILLYVELLIFEGQSKERTMINMDNS